MPAGDRFDLSRSLYSMAYFSHNRRRCGKTCETPRGSLLGVLLFCGEVVADWVNHG